MNTQHPSFQFSPLYPLGSNIKIETTQNECPKLESTVYMNVSYHHKTKANTTSDVQSIRNHILSRNIVLSPPTFPGYVHFFQHSDGLENQRSI